MDYKKEALKIIDNLGGNDNIREIIVDDQIYIKIFDHNGVKKFTKTHNLFKDECYKFIVKKTAIEPLARKIAALSESIVVFNKFL